MSNQGSLLLLVLVCTAGLLVTLHEGWPGAVSIDMFQTIQEANESRYEAHYDPMATMLWKIPLTVMDVPSAVATVFTVQALAYWLTFALMAWNGVRLGSRLTALVVLALAFSPPLLSYSIAIESNLQVAAWWGVSMLACLTWPRRATFFVVLPLLWFGFTGRYGTVVGFVPVAYFCVRVVFQGWSQLRVGGIAIGLALVMQLISYAVPKWVLQSPKPVSIMSVSQLFDMAGVYRLTGKHWIPASCIPEGKTVEEIVAIYDVRNCVPMFWSSNGKPIFTRPKTPEDAAVLEAAWRQTIQSEPSAYLSVKASYAAAFLSWGYECTYGVPDFTGGPYIGVEAPADPYTNSMVRYSQGTMLWLVWRGWIWLLVCTAVIAVAAWMRAKDMAAALAAFAAGVFLMIPHLVFGQGVVSRHFVPIYMMFTLCLALLLPRIADGIAAKFRRQAVSA